MWLRQSLWALITLVLLVSAQAFGAPVRASSQAVNWYDPAANPSGTAFVSQNQINPGNVGDLQLEWELPFPASSPVPGLNFTGQGSITPPLIVNGLVYLMMNDLLVVALDAATGSSIWSYRPVLNTTGLPLSELAGHVHGITYYEGNIWVSLPDCSALALAALTGAVVAKISDICAGIPGNAGKYNYSGTPLAFYRDVLIWSASDVSGGTDAGRGFVAGYNITNGELLWRWYVVPPAGGQGNWDTYECPPTSCRGNVVSVSYDWGDMGYVNGTTRAGGGPDWDQMAIDNQDGLVFLGTSEPAPQGNATYRPGPNLFSDSIVALNATSGAMAWYFQATPHDLYDFDCGWNVAFASITTGGQNESVVFKQCKNGYVYALDAKTGGLLWYFNPPSEVRLNTANGNFVVTGKYAANQTWINAPSNSTAEQCPGIEGGIESDIAVAYGKVFVATHNFCTFVTVGPVNQVAANESGLISQVPAIEDANTTIYALNDATGSPVWSYFIPSVPYRGWLAATGGMVFASSLNGDIIALDADTGRVDGAVHIGASLYEGVTVGSTISGQVMVFQLLSSPTYSATGSGIPGALLAYGLGPAPESAIWVYFPWVLSAVLAATVTILLVENRALDKKQVSRGG